MSDDGTRKLLKVTMSGLHVLVANKDVENLCCSNQWAAIVQLVNHWRQDGSSQLEHVLQSARTGLKSRAKQRKYSKGLFDLMRCAMAQLKVASSAELCKAIT